MNHHTFGNSFYDDAYENPEVFEYRAALIIQAVTRRTLHTTRYISVRAKLSALQAQLANAQALRASLAIAKHKAVCSAVAKRYYARSSYFAAREAATRIQSFLRRRSISASMLGQSGEFSVLSLSSEDESMSEDAGTLAAIRLERHATDRRDRGQSSPLQRISCMK